MRLYEYARKLNRVLKEKKKEEAGKYLSPVRRIERFAPIHDQRLVAMTFDDGPMNMPPEPVNDKYSQKSSLTGLLAEIMRAFDAKGTFNVVGTTAENYPDKEGKVHSSRWGGTMHDHYPRFGNDQLAGAVNQPELIRMLLSEGHELSNHGYRHVLFGPNKMVYGSRHHFRRLGEVTNDLGRLHALVEKDHGYVMRLSRPPHYIDKIPDGYDSYDAYASMGYDYLAASFDGGGWLPTTGDYKADVRKMVAPLESVLQKDSGNLNGQIIFQKDGYNMSLMTPVAHALEEHLSLLVRNGYRVITVGDMKKLSPFEDIDTSADYIDKLRSLDQKGYVIGYKNNTFKPEQPLTIGEMLTMTLTKADYSAFLNNELGVTGDDKRYKAHPYFLAYKKYSMLDQLGGSGNPASSEVLKKFLYEKLGQVITIDSKTEVLRREYITVLSL